MSVNWPWLLLPALLVFLTGICLFGTIAQNKRSGYEVWKTSSIVALQTLGGESLEELSGLRKISELERRAEEMKVRLEREEGRWVLK